MDFLSDHTNPKKKLFNSNRRGDHHHIHFAGKGNIRIDDGKIILDVQRSNLNNIYWLEISPDTRHNLRGVVNMSNNNLKINDVRYR